MALFRRRPEPTPEEQFVQRVGNLTLGLPVIERVEQVGPMTLEAYRPGNPMPVRLELANLYMEIGHLPTPELRSRIAEFVGHVTQPPRTDDWETARPDLLPSVKAISWSLGMAADHRPIQWPIAPQVIGALAVDGPTSIAFPLESSVADWPVTAEEAWALACEQLAAQGLPLVPADGDLTGAHLVAGPEAFASSWLAVPKALLLAPIDGDVVVIAPRRDDVILVPADDEELVVRALGAAEDAFRNDARPLSPAPYLVTDDGIVPWLPSVTHQAHLAARHAHRLFALAEYGEQLDVLVPFFEAAGEDLYVAILGARRDDAGRTSTYAVWPEAVSCTLLPQADQIALVDRDEHFTTVTWDDVMEVAGHLLQPEAGLDPPRWRVERWPDADQLAELERRRLP